MISMSREGKPDLDEPWIQGVEWTSGATGSLDDLRDQLADGATVVLRADALGPEAAEVAEMIEACAAAEVERLVHVTTGHASSPTSEETDASQRRLLDLDDSFRLGSVVLRLPEILAGAAPVGDDREEEGCPPIPLGQGAMAVVRTAVEPDHRGIIDCREATDLGFSVMLQ